MKTKFLSVCIGILCTINVFSQNYLTIKNNAVSFYQGNSNLNVFPIRIDSISTHGDSTDYFSFYMIRPLNESGLYTTKGTPWIGKKMEDCGNGINLFFNKENDTIFIKTNAALHEAWKMFSFSNGNYIEATVSTLQSETFLGLTDSVKTIILQMKDNTGNNLSDAVNNLTLKISKNYGFLKIADFYNFPFNLNPPTDEFYSDSTLSLIGLTNPLIGWKNITLSDIFTMQPGDEIDYYRYNSNNFFNEKKICKYLSRSVDIALNKVTFNIEVCDKYQYFAPPQSITLTHDTIQEADSLLGGLNALPFEPVIDNGYYTYYIKNDSIVNKFSDFTSVVGIDSVMIDLCWEDPNCGEYYNIYYKNLGYTINYHSNNMGDIFDNIVYYNIQGISWGVPYICDTLMLKSPVITNLPDIRIFPNPASNYIQINFPCEVMNAYVQISNLQGNILLSQLITCRNQMIDISAIPEGFYIIVISNENIHKTQKLLINK
jgi:hypothetical protein